MSRVIKATLEDYKRIKTRAAWQIILEVDESQFPKVLEALGNPTSGESAWVEVKLDEPPPAFLKKEIEGMEP
jgi:hypothetical protein